MRVEAGKVRKPIRELRRSLKTLPGDPPARTVHRLRTTTRRLEAIALALAPDHGHGARQLIKSIKPLRKAAGQVRDMDVLATKAKVLLESCPRQSVERLLERLFAIRIDGAQHLAEAVAEQRKHTSRSLKRFSRQIEREQNQEERHSAEVRRLIHELSNWPSLTAENLHDFRIKVKELRYVLQLTQDTSDTSPKFGKALDAVKSRIGDWHDWLEMDRIAHEVLDARKDSQALKKISEIEEQKLERALKSAQSLRARYLRTHTSHPVAEP